MNNTPCTQTGNDCYHLHAWNSLMTWLGSGFHLFVTLAVLAVLIGAWLKPVSAGPKVNARRRPAPAKAQPSRREAKVPVRR
jgi:hypothetical protein